MEFLEIVNYETSTHEGKYPVTNDPYLYTGHSKPFLLVLKLPTLSNKNLALSEIEFRSTRKKAIKSRNLRVYRRWEGRLAVDTHMIPEVSSSPLNFSSILPNSLKFHFNS